MRSRGFRSRKIPEGVRFAAAVARVFTSSRRRVHFRRRRRPLQPSDREGGLPGRPGRVGRLVAEQRAERRAERQAESSASTTGGNGRRTSPKCAFAITASRSGFGMPLLFVLPSAARRVHRLEQLLELQRRADLAAEAGVSPRRRSRTCAGCRLDHDDSPAAATTPPCPARNPTYPVDHLEALGLRTVDVGRGDRSRSARRRTRSPRTRRSCRRSSSGTGRARR